jgi:NAD(P)-dependent dehydrogenase (short-subunit alcohol dehydrogenase family)
MIDLGLSQRVVIITGGSAGIGRAIAALLAAEGARVVIAARRKEALESTAEAIEKQTGNRVLAICADTTVQEQVDRLVERVMGEYSRVDVLVNCAANPSGLVRNEVQHLDDAALLQDLNTKVVGYARCSKAVAPIMIEQRWGRIIHIGGLTGRASNVISGMRNAAVCHLTKTLSDQLGPFGITVNAIHPGVIQTEHIVELFQTEARKRGKTAAEIEAEYANSTPIRRIIRADEVGYAVAFLSSDLAAAITGESLAVDGGITRGIYL